MIILTVTAALDIYRKDRKDISDNKRLDNAITNLQKFFNLVDLEKVDISTCKNYAKFRKTHTTKRHGEMRPTSDSTIARELGVLKAAANHALKHKLIKLDKFPTFEIPKDLPKGQLWLFEDEYYKLLDHARKYPDGMYLYIKLLYVTASRRAAIERLEWSQVNFTNKTLKLNKHDQKVTKKRRPTVPIGDTIDYLQDCYDSRTNDYVLGSGADRYSAFIKLAKAAGVYELPERDGRPAGRITPHVLRHTRATHLLEAGMSIYKVAQLLGDNPTTVERVYAHACTSSLGEDLIKYGV